MFVFRASVFVAQCAEGPTGLVGREPLVPEIEDWTPVLVDAADETHAHVAVAVQPKASRRNYKICWRKLSVAGPALPDRAEEFTGREVAVLVEVLESLLAAEAVLAVDEVLVALVLEVSTS